MDTKTIAPMLIVVGLLAGLAPLSLAQPSSPSAARPESAAPGQGKTIDCPPAAAGEPPRQEVGSPQGTGTGSGLTALPSVGPSQRVDGEIKTIGSTRTNRILEIGDLTLEVEPSTVILVGCKPGSIADLKQGTKVKVAYEVKEPHRNVATVIEAEG